MKLYVLFILCLLSAHTFATETVKIGVYDFPPYVFIGDKTSGITIDIISAMNKLQNEYEFIAVPTTARRRYRDFENNMFDMMFFESENWGWKKYPVVSSKAFVTGAEVYVTQAKPGREQSFFSDFKNRTMIGVLGYHYKFADFNADQEYLNNNFNLIQTESQKQSLELILKNRGEIAVISKEYLNYYFVHSPADKAKLLISEKFDQVYQHTILIRKQSKVTVSYINNLLDEMKKKDVLIPLWKQYDLKELN
jgi:ABC-type amino acid transport substrate-binding protein